MIQQMMGERFDMDDKPVDEDNALAKNTDILQREEFIDRVLTIINSCKEQPRSLSFSIDSGWGYGKSFILDRVQEQLADDWIVLRYDSWKYDYYEEPLVALVSSISDQLQEHSSGIDPKLIRSIAETAADMALDAAAMAAGPNALLVKLAGNAAKKVCKKIQAAKKAARSYDKYSSLKKNLSIIQELLRKIGETKPVVLMIDELDRCLPAYQIKVLERIHHVVNESNNVVVYALNPNQLSETIKQIYGGNDERVTAYLKKFLDFSLPLDIGMVSEKVMQKYASDIASFDSILDNTSNGENTSEWFKRVCMQLLEKLEIREQEKLWQKRRIIHDIIFSKKDKPLPPVYLTCELMLLAMNEWQKRAYIPTTLIGIDWAQEKTLGAFLNEGFRSDSATNTAIQLPGTVQSFWAEVSRTVFSDSASFFEDVRHSRTYWIDSSIPKSVTFLAAAWTHANDNSTLQFKREHESEIKAADDMFIHLKQSMKEFNDFVKIMS